MTLKQQTFSAIRWTTFSSTVRSVLQILQVGILARLLAPSDFGLVALVTSIMAFVQIFADAGISNAVIHYQKISQNQLSSLYWLNVGASLCLASLLAVLSPWVSAWFAQPQMKPLLLATGCTLVTGALAQQIRVVAQKNMLFAKLTVIDLLAAGLGFAVAVSSAYYGAGVYSIVAGSFTATTIGSGLVWYRLAGGWHPQFRLNFNEIRHFLSFGAYMIGNNLANTFNSQMDIVLGGKILGPQAIGLYSVPRNLNLAIAGIINPIATNVGLPVMAKARRDMALLRRVYMLTMRMTASVNFPIYVTMAFFASEIVRTLLGARWEAAIPLLRILAVWALLRSTGNPVGSLLMACGRADLSFKWNVVLLVVVPPFIYVSSGYGISGMALAMTALATFLYWPNWYFQVRPLCGAKFGEYFTQIAVPLVLSILSVASGFGCARFFTSDMLRLTVGVLIACVIYLGLSRWFNRPWVESLKELMYGSLVSSRG